MSRGLAGALLAVAVILGIFGLLNHYSLKINAVPHTSTIVLVLAVIFGVVGLAGFVMKKS